MYTSNDFETRDDYDDDYEEAVEEATFYERNKNIIFKVIIIILCIIILIWLIAKLNNKKTNNLPSNYDSNVTQVRLASEQHFFINNKPGTATQTITVNDLIARNLIKEVKKSDGTSCNTSGSKVTLENNGINYIMTINLDCGDENNTKVFYYRVSDYACENCNGTTYMTGTTVPTEPDTPVTPDDPSGYTCTWSDWSTTRNYDTNLQERSRVVVKAQKQETKETVVYGEWSGYSEDYIEASDTLEVQTKVDTVSTWVDRTSSSAVYESNTIRNVRRETSRGSSYTYCPDGYEKADGRCRKAVPSRTISTTDYVKLSGEERKNCYSKRETANKVVYVCGGGYTYTDLKTGYHGGSTTYYYQELQTSTRTLYRSRTKTVEVVVSEPIYTDYILESEIPAGYTKVPGSDRVEYSYRLNTCGDK